MSQMNTNTGGGNINHNQNVARGRWGQGGFGGQGQGGRSSNYKNSSIAKFLFDGTMKDGCLSKLTITESTNWAIQFKKITDALPVFFVQTKNNTELLQAAF